MADTTEAKRLQQLKQIDTLLKEQQRILKELSKEKEKSAATDKKIENHKKEINKLLKEQTQLERKIRN